MNPKDFRASGNCAIYELPAKAEVGIRSVCAALDLDYIILVSHSCVFLFYFVVFSMLVSCIYCYFCAFLLQVYKIN